MPFSDGHARSRPSRRLWAYLNDPMPVDGPRLLLEQKAIVDDVAARAGRSVERYVVDSGSALTRRGRGSRLQAMIEEAVHAGRRVTVIVASPKHLATTPPDVTSVLAELLAAGIAVKDGSGELQPSPRTIALARAAASLASSGRASREMSGSRDNG